MIKTDVIQSFSSKMLCTFIYKMKIKKVYNQALKSKDFSKAHVMSRWARS